MFTSRIFEFLGATGSDGTTPVPGPDSFTSALIWALSGLSSREGGFTTSQLQRMIREAPNLPKNQVPVLLDRSPGSVKRLMLAPLQARSSANAREDAPEDVKFTLSEVDMNRSVEADEEPSEQWSLNLQLLMQDLPTPDAITKIAAGFRNLMTSGDIVVQRIEWKGLSLVRSKGLSTPEVKSPAMLGVAQLMALRWQNRVLKKKVNSLSLLSRLLPVPLNPDRERPMPESEPIVLDRNRKPVSTGPSTGLGDQVYTQRVSRLLNFMSNHLFLVSTVSTIAFTMGGFSVPWILTWIWPSSRAASPVSVSFVTLSFDLILIGIYLYWMEQIWGVRKKKMKTGRSGIQHERHLNQKEGVMKGRSAGIARQEVKMGWTLS